MWTREREESRELRGTGRGRAHLPPSPLQKWGLLLFLWPWQRSQGWPAQWPDVSKILVLCTIHHDFFFLALLGECLPPWWAEVTMWYNRLSVQNGSRRGTIKNCRWPWLQGSYLSSWTIDIFLCGIVPNHALSLVIHPWNLKLRVHLREKGGFRLKVESLVPYQHHISKLDGREELKSLKPRHPRKRLVSTSIQQIIVGAINPRDWGKLLKLIHSFNLWLAKN